MKSGSGTATEPPLPGDGAANAAVAAVIFGVATYAIASLRASLNPDGGSGVLNPKRALLVLVGALVFWLVIRVREAERLDAARLGEMVRIALPGMALMFGVAICWDHFVTQDTANSAARNVRWMLLWSGYFGTALAAWLALRYRQALAQAQRDQHDGITALAPVTANDEVFGPGFWVKTGRQTVFIARGDVEWIEAEGNYARVHGADGAHGLLRMSLAAIEAQLDGDEFIRMHRSAICRRSAIRGYRRRPSGAIRALLASGAEAPVGRSFARVLADQARVRLGDEGSVTVTSPVGAKPQVPESV